MTVYVSRTRCGFCFGVQRAVAIAEQALHVRRTLYSIGGLIHNEEQIRQLQKKGMRVVRAINEVPRGATLVVRSHGLSPRLILQARAQGVRVIDATCPFVKIAHEAMKVLKNEGYFVLLLGDMHHPEVRTLRDIVGARQSKTVGPRQAVAAKTVFGKKIGVIAQTTQMPQALEELARKTLALRPRELRVYNTICRDVIERQQEARTVARCVDVVFVIGGSNSANTTRLFQICRAHNRRTFKIQNESMLQARMVALARRIGIITGASTPRFLVERVIERIGAYSAGQSQVIGV